MLLFMGKNIFTYKESVGNLFYGFTLSNRVDFVNGEQVGDALTGRFLS